MIEFTVGMKLNLNDECVGTVTQATEDRVFIESDEFTGWATKAEISSAIESAREGRSQRTQPQCHSSAA